MIRCRVAIRGCLTAALLMAAPLAARGQVDGPGTEAPAAAPEETIADGGQAGFPHSALPPAIRVQQQIWRQALELAAAGDSAVAVRLLRTILESSDDGWIAVPGASPDARVQLYRGLRGAATQLLNQLPPAARQLYRQQTESLAQTAFDAALTDSDMEELRKVAVQYPLTQAGYDALRHLAAWQMDRGDTEAARGALLALKVHPRAKQDEQALAAEQIRWLNALAGGSADNTAKGGEPMESGAGRTSAEPAWPLELFPAAARPVWQSSELLDADSATLAQHALLNHARQSIPVLLAARPLVLDHAIITRTPRSIFAQEITTGRRLWEAPLEASTESLTPRLTMNMSLQDLVGRSLARQLQTDTVQTRIVPAGDLLLMVEPGVMTTGHDPAPMGRKPEPASADRARPAFNRVVARDAGTGEVRWTLTVDAILRATTDGDAVPPVTESLDVMSGPPTPVDRLVVGRAQRGSILYVYAADRVTGDPLWSLPIGLLSRDSVADADWQSIACPVEVVDGVLICPTAAGLIVGVDLTTRQALWATRLTRADLPPFIRHLSQADVTPQRHWWRGWREVDLNVVRVPADDSFPNGRSVVLASGPDVDGLMALDVQDGSPVWSHPVDQPLYVAGIWRDTTVVVARHAVTAVDVSTGTPRWTSPLVEPIGRGFSMDLPTSGSATSSTAFHVVPVRAGRLAAIRLSDGAVTRSTALLSPASINLAGTADHVVGLELDRISVWPVPTKSGRTVTESATPADAVVIEQAIAERNAGRFAVAALLLRSQMAGPAGAPDAPEPRGSASEAARRELVRTLILWIEQADVSLDSDGGIQRLVDEVETLADPSDVASRIAALHAAARRAAATRQFATAVEWYQRMVEFNPSGDVAVEQAGPGRIVRIDRQIQAEVQDLLDAVAPDERIQLEARLRASLNQAARSPDPFALQRFSQRWGQLAPVAESLLPDEARIGQGFNAVQLALLELGGRGDAEVAQAAGERLASEYEARSYPRDAATLIASAQRRFGVSAPPGESGDQTPGRPRMSQPEAVELLSRSPWSQSDPRVTERTMPYENTSFQPVLVECATGSLFQRIQVSVRLQDQRNQTVVRFDGDGHSGSWRVDLPRSSSQFHPIWTMPRGWGAGHFLVLRIGAELFGITPFNDSGEPRARLLWSLNMAENSRLVGHQYVPESPGFRGEDLIFLDAFDRPIGQVGPVQAGFTCCQMEGRLVCVETGTGRQLWERSELPRDAVVCGTENSASLIDRDTGQVTVLRTLDGRETHRYPLRNAAPVAGAQLLHTIGGHAVLGVPANGTDLLRLNWIGVVELETARLLWSVNSAAGFSACSPGPDWLGLLDSTGALRLVETVSGATVAEHRVEVPATLKAVHCIPDALGPLIMLSELPDGGFQQPGVRLNGFRQPLVRGTLVALHPVSGDLQWQRAVPELRMALDQPRQVPFSVFTDHRRSEDPTGRVAVEPVLHLIDRRTGRDLHVRRGSAGDDQFVIEPDAASQQVVIRMPRTALRLDYLPEPDDR